MTSLIKELRKHTSTLTKQNILKSMTTLGDAEVFQWTYDPFKRYNLHFDHVNMDNLGCIKNEMFDILNNLASRKLTGNEARAKVVTYAHENGDLIKLICNKDLDCGVSITTLNTVFGKDFIPKFCIQLAKEEDLDKIVFPIWGQLKYNGARVLTIVKDGIVTFKSRGGHEFSFPQIEKIIKELVPYTNEGFVLDGELTFGDSQNEDHTKVSGLVNSSIKGTPIKDNLGLVYHIFDMIPLPDFNKQSCKLQYEFRLRQCKEFVDFIDSKYIKRAITYTFSNRQELEVTYDELLAKGYEGLILKAPNHLYTFKKNKTWIKMKATDTADLQCTDYIEGTGKYEGMIGSLVCSGRIGNNFIKVNVGSGLNDSDRGIDPQKYIGKTIEVAYNKVIQDTKSGTYSLFLPRFLQVRRDKC